MVFSEKASAEDETRIGFKVDESFALEEARIQEWLNDDSAWADEDGMQAQLEQLEKHGVGFRMFVRFNESAVASIKELKDYSERRYAMLQLKAQVLKELLEKEVAPEESPDEILHMRWLGSIPAISVRLNREQLERLMEIPEIATVAEDPFVSVTSSSWDGIRIEAGLPAIQYRLQEGQFVSRNGPRRAVVIDGGFRPDHESIKGRVFDQHCFIAPEFSKVPDPDNRCDPNNPSADESNSAVHATCPSSFSNHQEKFCEHGTAVAGVLAGAAPDPTQGPFKTGFAPHLEIGLIRALAPITINAPDYQVCDFESRESDPASQKTCHGMYISDLQEALEKVEEWQAAYGNIDVVAASFAGAGFDNLTDCEGYGLVYPPTSSTAVSANQALENKIADLRQAGIAFVAPVGHQHLIDQNMWKTTGVGWPACLSSAVAVQGSEPSAKNLEKFTPTLDSTSASSIPVRFAARSDVITAPYVNQYQDYTSCMDSYICQTQMIMGSGVSFAVPQVAAAYAIARIIHPSLSLSDVESLIEATGTDVYAGNTPQWKQPNLGDLGRRLVARSGLHLEVTGPSELTLSFDDNSDFPEQTTVEISLPSIDLPGLCQSQTVGSCFMDNAEQICLSRMPSPPASGCLSCASGTQSQPGVTFQHIIAASQTVGMGRVTTVIQTPHQIQFNGCHVPGELNLVLATVSTTVTDPLVGIRQEIAQTSAVLRVPNFRYAAVGLSF